MVIKPRSLEEIAAEQASVASQPTPADTPVPRTEARVTVPAQARPEAAPAPPTEHEKPWDPFAEDPPAPADDPDVPPRRTPNLWKPVEEPRDVKTRLRTWGLISLAIGVTFAAVWLAFNFSKIMTSQTAQVLVETTTQWLGPPQPISVSISLVNECPFSEKAFMAKVMPDGPTAEFLNGKASLQALPNQRIKLIANTKYPNFHYDTGSIPVAPEMTLTANCDNMEERAKAIAESLRDAFKK